MTNTFREHLQRAIFETFHLWDIWLEWWENITWPSKDEWSTGPYVPALVPPLFHFVPPILGLQSCLWQKKHIFGHFQPLWSPLKAKSEWQKGPNPLAHMSPYLFHPCSTLFHPFGASRAAYGQKSTFLAIFRPFSAPPEPIDGNFWTEKWSQSTGPYVPSLVPTLFHFVPPIWGVQNPLMAYVPKCGHFWAVFGHKSALNGWNKVWSNWHTVYPTPPDQIQSLVLSN